MSQREELLSAFKLGIVDLEANRSGRLRPAQQRNLLKSGNRNIAGALLIGVVLAAILYGVAQKPLALVQWLLSLVLFSVALVVGIVEARPG